MQYTVGKYAAIEGATLISALRQLRADGVSMGRVAVAFGVAEVAVQRWLRGERRPSRQTLVMARYVLSEPFNLAPGLPSISGQSAPDPRTSSIGPRRPARARKLDAG
jgi:transcriptional regulator with XRE-family HTH domain